MASAEQKITIGGDDDEQVSDFIVLDTEGATVTENEIFLPVRLELASGEAARECASFIRVAVVGYDQLSYAAPGAPEARPLATLIKERFDLLAIDGAELASRPGELVIPLPSGRTPFLTLLLETRVVRSGGAASGSSPFLYLVFSEEKGRYEIATSTRFYEAQLKFYPPDVAAQCAPSPKTCGMAIRKSDVQRKSFR
ncbi:MAG: hypothetical protein C4523_10320 [Myxococcales bacterium]|nr:MAG: hypothetical protein C4523_10320 [Myxococcales bacterium]